MAPRCGSGKRKQPIVFALLSAVCTDCCLPRRSDGWKSYADECAPIECAYALQGQTGSHLLRGGKYKIDFQRMRQVRVDNVHKTRAVRRTA